MKFINLEKLKIYTIIFLSIFCIFIILETYKSTPKNLLKVHFLNVGQGDSTLIQTPSHKNILIDTGKDAVTLSKLGEKLRENSFFNRSDFEMIILTHDDLDHIGALPFILEKYKVKILLTSLASSTNSTWQESLKIANNKNIQIKNINSGGEIDLGDNLRIKILFPITNMNNVEDGNSASVVTQIIYGKNKFLLTGDLGHTGELFLKNIYNEKLQSEILKLGHHGSDTSSHPEFLNIVKPEVALISAGKNNSFGHPHKTVLDLLDKFKIKYLETSKENTITFISDGINVWKD
jgi:competence protein ComEC